MNRSLPSFLLLLIILGSGFSGCSQSDPETSSSTGQSSLRACEWCGAMDAPEDLDWQARIAGAEEPGRPLVLTGTVFETDGTTPAEGVLIYAYHTNSEGIYEKKGDETGNGQRHGHLRSWVRTGKDGRYQFTTIQPAPYPSNGEPAHVHLSLTPPEQEEYYISSTIFQGDPLISEQELQEAEKEGRFSRIIHLEEDEDGILYGNRDLLLKVE